MKLTNDFFMNILNIKAGNKVKLGDVIYDIDETGLLSVDNPSIEIPFHNDYLAHALFFCINEEIEVL